MSLIKYAVVQSSANTASVVGYYDDSVTPFNTWKTEYEAAHAGDTVVNINTSDFPAGMGWSISSDGNTYPPTSTEGTFDYIKAMTVNNINAKTDLLMYAGTFTYDGKQFSQDHDTRDNLALLLSLKNDIPSGSYPILVAASSPVGDYVSLADKNAVSAFLLPLLESQISSQNSGVNEIITVDGYTTISQLVGYTDTRS